MILPVFNYSLTQWNVIAATWAKINMETGTMSTSLAGEYDEVMEILTGSMREFMEKYPSVFCIKISNACNSCKKTS
jgi:uncharacterized protein YqgV (UPF0045/DUF77 family)